MLRVILTAAALLAVCAAPASAATSEEKSRSSDQPAPAADTGARDLRSSDAIDAAEHRGLYAAKDVSEGQDLRLPDAVDAAEHRGLNAREPERGPYVVSRGYGSPDAADAARDLPPVQVPVVAAQPNPSGGFDWGDAGIGAAGMLGLFGIAGASALMLTGRKRRHGLGITTQ